MHNHQEQIIAKRIKARKNTKFYTSSPNFVVTSLFCRCRFHYDDERLQEMITLIIVFPLCSISQSLKPSVSIMSTHTYDLTQLLISYPKTNPRLNLFIGIKKPQKRPKKSQIYASQHVRALQHPKLDTEALDLRFV